MFSYHYSPPVTSQMLSVYATKRKPKSAGLSPQVTYRLLKLLVSPVSR